MSHGTVRIEWQVEDGYVTGSRPHYTIIHLSELEYCETEQQARDAIDEMVQEDFQQRIYYSTEEQTVEAALKHWREDKK